MMSVSLSGGARGWLEHSFFWISPTYLSKGDGVRVGNGSGRSPSTCSSTVSKLYVAETEFDVATGRACECWAGVAPTDPRTGRTSTCAAVQLRSSGVEANHDRGGSRYGESRRRRTTGRGRRRRSSGYGGNDVSTKTKLWMHACLAGEGVGGGGRRWSLLAMASSRRVLGAGRKEEGGREEEEREEGQLQSLLRSSRKATWHGRKPHAGGSFRKIGVHVACRSVSGRPVGLANVLQGAHTERSSLLSSLSSQGSHLRSSQLAWQAKVPTGRRLTGSGQTGRASYSIGAPYPDDDDFLREDKDSRSSSSFSSSPLLSSSRGIANSQSRDSSSIGGGSIFFLERQRRRGLARVILYWLSFGALTAASASALEYLLHPRLKVPPWAIGGGFAAVVSAIAILNFVKMSLMSLRERGGSGAVIARDLGGTEADPDVHADLISIVRDISLRAGIPCPRIFIVPCRELNAFATGLSESRDASITVTQGLLDTLSNTELSAVLGHEIGHIVNGDMRSGTHMASILLGFYGVFVLGMRMWEAASLYSSRRFGSVLGLGIDDREVDGGEGAEALPPQERDSVDLRAIAVPLIAVGLVAYAIGTIMQKAVSRTQELSADSIGVALTDAGSLKSALLKISDHGNDDHRQRRPKDLQRMYQGRHVAHTFIHRDKGWISALLPDFVSGFLSILSTHPPTAVRLREIDKVSIEIQRLDAAAD